MGREGVEVLLFVSPKCPHCPRAEYTAKKIVPEYSEHGATLKKIRIKTREGRQIAEKFGVMSTPTMLFVKEHSVVHRIVGAPELSSMRKAMEKALGIRKSFIDKILGR